MDREELKAIVAQMLRELAPAQTPPSPPPVKGAETAPEAPPDDGVLPDLTTVDLRAQYLVPNAAHGAEFRALKAKTPARLGLGRCGARYPTASMLRFRAGALLGGKSLPLCADHVQKQGRIPDPAGPRPPL